MKTLWDILDEKSRYQGPELGTHTHPWKAAGEPDNHRKTLRKYQILRNQTLKQNPNAEHGNVVRSYKDTSMDINGPLRNSRGNVDAVPAWRRSHIEALDHLTSHRTKASMTLYRGIYPEGGAGSIALDRWDQSHKYPKGSLHTDHGYTGTTPDHYIAKSFGASVQKSFTPKDEHYNTVAKIHIPKGTKGHYLDDHHYNVEEDVRGEKEFLLHRGTTFRVTGHHVDHDKKIHYIHMEVHSQREPGESK